jgi:hypothetical protein
VNVHRVEMATSKPAARAGKEQRRWLKDGAPAAAQYAEADGKQEVGEGALGQGDAGDWPKAVWDAGVRQEVGAACRRSAEDAALWVAGGRGWGR